MQSKTISDSFTIQTHIVLPSDSNSSFSLFGGVFMKWIDEISGVVARRHSGHQVCTASVGRLDFLVPAYLNDIITIEGRIIHAGNTSMLVQVNSFIEHPSDPEKRKLVNSAYLTMVALDDEGKPTQVPSLIAENEEDALLLEFGKRKKELFQKQ